MDDCCAVCAEPLEWVAYGSCLHREVCSTCVARLRFICDDRRCCICKTQCDRVFVTKALGDFTRVISNFSGLPSDVREGHVGSYWYHEDTNAFFDDVDHYKMIKAMCKLSCSVCDKMEEQAPDASKRRARFRNIEQLKGHLFRFHRLLMCSLCLEGRKVFICEQKLYTRAQLNQHISTGDSEVDGSESERGGFMGHPMCEFCRTPFYGDNELYTHMSTEHFTCHICQRQHPGRYEYYKNYDDLEIHFRQEHFLCEDEACLAKKFIVFQSEAEMKRHNAIEHGGRMSRSKRNAALQIPTSFRYRHGNQQDQRRGRGRTFRRDLSESELSMAIQASFDIASADSPDHDPATSSSGQVAVGYGNLDDDPGIQSSESLGTSSSELSSRYLQALGHNSGSSPLEGSSFPPLPIASINGQAKPKNEPEGSSSNTMAAHLRRHNNRNASALNSASGWSVASRGSVQSSSNPMRSKRPTNVAPGVSGNSSQAKIVVNHGPAPSSYASSVQATQRTALGHLSSGTSREIRDNVSATKANKLPASSQSLAVTNVEDVHSANKSLVEKIRGALDFDQERFTLFKDVSAQYRQGIIDAGTYLDYVQQFGLSHLVLELARLCPDPHKQKELIDYHNVSLQRIALQENDRGGGSIHHKDGKVSKKGKGKGKSIDIEERNYKDNLEDSFVSTVRQLQLNHKLSEENAEVLSKGDYRITKGKSKILADEQLIGTNSHSLPNPKQAEQSEASLGSFPSQSKDEGASGIKQRKKTSKFIRMRLGDGSVEALLDPKSSNANSDPGSTEALDGNKNGAGGLPVRGVWRNGGHKLFS
ncbi:hypothetical protein K1719_035532 [Acacia pycnantha]|nr:hypothetical protein K1719_035532 [Acacia pycnantha]